jgi:hypothetical protein
LLNPLGKPSQMTRSGNVSAIDMSLGGAVLQCASDYAKPNHVTFKKTTALSESGVQPLLGFDHAISA